MTTIVIGAGMAGLAAARVLSDAGEQILILEGRDRIGGRAYTNRTFCDIPVEFGAEFIHGDNAATWEWVRTLGLNTLHWRKTDDSMIRLEDGSWMTMAEARKKHPDFDVTRSWNLPDNPVFPQDESFDGYLLRLGFTDEQMQYTRRTFANAVGDSMTFTSAAAILEVIAESRQHW